MKVLLSSNVCLGALPAENMDVERTEKWQKNRIEHVKDLIDKAAQNNAKYIALFGRVFGAERVSESVIDSLFGAISSDKHIQTFLFLNAEEYRRISYRKDIPNNLHLLCPAIEDSYIYEDISVSTHSDIIKFNLVNGKSVFVKGLEIGYEAVMHGDIVQYASSSEKQQPDDPVKVSKTDLSVYDTLLGKGVSA